MGENVYNQCLEKRWKEKRRKDGNMGKKKPIKELKHPWSSYATAQCLPSLPPLSVGEENRGRKRENWVVAYKGEEKKKYIWKKRGKKEKVKKNTFWKKYLKTRRSRISRNIVLRPTS